MSEQGDTSTGTYAASAERSPQPAGRPTEGVHREEAQPLTPDTVAEAVVELIRLAIEHEQRHQSYRDPSIVDHDRHAQIEVHRIANADTYLRTVVRTLRKYRDARRDGVNAVRAARAAQQISEFVGNKEDEWQEMRLERRKNGSPDTGPTLNATFRRAIGDFIERACARAELTVDAEQRDVILTAALDPMNADAEKGRFDRIANAMQRVGITPVKARTSQSILSALDGREQSSGQITHPKQAELVHDYDPLSPVYLLEYLCRHTDKGLHGIAGEALIASGDEAVRAWIAAELRKLADTLSPIQAVSTP